jgi:hypothetical protein
LTGQAATHDASLQQAWVMTWLMVGSYRFPRQAGRRS